MLHLPDLPNVGYSTTAAKQTTDAIMMFMRAVERNRAFLLEIVLDGQDKFVKVGRKELRGAPIDADVLKSIWRYFALQAMRTDFQLQALNGGKWDDVLKRAMPDIEDQALRLKQQALEEKWMPHYHG